MLDRKGGETMKLLVTILMLFVLFACGTTSTDEMPEVFSEIAQYENPYVTIVQYLGPTTDNADKEAFIDWLKHEGYEATDDIWDFSYYGYYGHYHFIKGDMVLTLDVFKGDQTTVLTTLEASLDMIDELTVPDTYPEHGFMFDEGIDLDPIGERIFLPDHPIAIAFYNPLDLNEHNDSEAVYIYFTKSEIDALFNYYETVLEAEGFVIADLYDDEDDYIYIFAEREDAAIEIVISSVLDYDGFYEVFVHEFIEYR